MTARQKWWLVMLLAAGALTVSGATRIVFLAGGPSHPPGEHEHRAGCLLLQSCLEGMADVTTVVYSNGWPAAPEVFTGADAVVLYSDGGRLHPLLQGDRLTTLGKLMDRGVGLAVLHWACDVAKDYGQREFLDWLGGCYEQHWSVNPLWTAEFKTLPAHPITRGVNPFQLYDEWYFHLRFREGLDRVVPLLTTVAPASTMARPDGPHTGNPAVREAVERQVPQIVAWAAERAQGGRGFGFTGGHYHKNWGHDDFRKLVLNGILWVAKVEVPANGVASTVTPTQLEQNLDFKGPQRPRPSSGK
ncbi:MAG TPA: ThuA domain-containing protein [Verrucomicrobiota bacterium]|nr:ThuA domain-containing protein [Verrucomicrobiota bacterium]HQB17204.1 ThuA domain-containing protein [Verrucomicrobiota bacterium]